MRVRISIKEHGYHIPHQLKIINLTKCINFIIVNNETFLSFLEGSNILHLKN